VDEILYLKIIYPFTYRQFTFRLEDEGTGAGNGITLLSVTLGFSVSL